jgi:hypothetical protein
MSLVVRRRFPLFALAALCAVVVVVTLVALPGLAFAASGKAVIVTEQGTVPASPPNSNILTLIASCPDGYQVSGGGFGIESVNPDNYVQVNGVIDPEHNDGRWGWLVTFLNFTGVDVDVNAQAVCMK